MIICYDLLEFDGLTLNQFLGKIQDKLNDEDLSCLDCVRFKVEYTGSEAIVQLVKTDNALMVE